MVRRGWFRCGRRARPEVNVLGGSTVGMLRVAVITTSFPLTERSASGPFVLELVRHLPDDIEPTVITPCGTDRSAPTTVNGYRLNCFRYAPRSWQILAHAPGGLPAALRGKTLAWPLLALFVPALFLASLRAARTADVIHANWSITGVIAGLAGRLTGTPCITTLRGTDVELGERSRLFRLALRLCVRLNRHSVTVGAGLRARIASLLGQNESSMAFIPNGIDQLFFDVPPPVAQPILTLVAIGSLVPVKGLETLLQALALLGSECDWRLTLVGEGPERSSIEARAQDLGISDRITLTGALAPAAIPGILAKHAVFILSSRSEGRPNALLEAMAAGRAIIASDIPGVRELIVDGRNGLLFPVDQPRALAECLRRLHDEPTWGHALGANARESVEGLRWTATGQAYAVLYRQAAAARAGRPGS